MAGEDKNEKITILDPEEPTPEARGRETQLSPQTRLWRRSQVSTRADLDALLYMGAALLLALTLAPCATIFTSGEDARGWDLVGVLNLLVSSVFGWAVSIPILFVGWAIPAWLVVGFPLRLLGMRWSGGNGALI